MDASRILTNNRGVGLVYLALVIIVVFIMAAFAVDVGYMYNTKTQLKNASDAGALAGVFRIMTSPLISDTFQTDARLLAKSFAERNYAATRLVNIASNGSNSLSDDNDITVGNWNSISRTYSPGQTPVNAIEVRAKRLTSANSADGNVESFFAKFLNINSFAIVPQSSIAAIPVRATGFIAMGKLACPPTGTVDTTERILDFSVAASDASNFSRAIAWSSLFDNNTNTGNVEKLICTETPSIEVCKADDGSYVPSRDDIYMSNSTDANLVRSFATAMYNPIFDSAYKDCAGVEKCIAGARVTGWDLILPVVDVDNPSVQPTPRAVIKYALVHVKAVCATGSSDGCSGYPIQGPPNDGQTGSSAPCSSYPNSSVIINSITCVPCNERFKLRGLKPALVQ
jgi:Flp pilus assembly protein TadG